jgi:oligoribonuclease
VITSQKTLIWIDLEMSGLNFEKDTILEIAVVVTDPQLNIIAQGPDLVIHQPDHVLAGMDQWCTNQHGKTGLTQAVRESTISLEFAQQQVLAFLQEYSKPKSSPLCGNSIWVDRLFLQKDMSMLSQFFHYKNIDVSSIKELVRYWYPNNPLTEFKKSDGHRAMQDITESIEELKFYRKNFFIS